MLDPILTAEIGEMAQRLVDQLREDITDKQVTQYGAINASGNLRASIRWELDDNGLRFYGADYYPFADAGREAGKMPPIAAIMQWITDKGIASETVPLKSQAYGIAVNIAKNGTVAYRQGGTHIIADVFTPKAITELATTIALGLEKQYINTIKEGFSKRRA
jgi:hypothetical protein